MTCFQPFKALRPRPEFAGQVLCPPYDVISAEEARGMAAENPFSFIHVIRAEADMPGADPYSDPVYRKGAENLRALERDGIFFTEKEPSYYIYSQTCGGSVQTGIVGCASIDDYENGTIKKHEVTRTEKELDRIRHFDACGANTEPVFFFFRKNENISEIMRRITDTQPPEYDIVDSSGVRHRLWPVGDGEICGRLLQLFEALPCMYIADGHHRTASAAKVGQMRRTAFPDGDGSEEFNRFMAVAFPADQLNIFGYHRLVQDLNGLSEAQFLKELSGICRIEAQRLEEIVPPRRRTCSLYLGGSWYLLSFEESSEEFSEDSLKVSPEESSANPAEDSGDRRVSPVDALDVSLLQNRILAPILGIRDPRTDSRIRFEGGTEGIARLKLRVDSGEMAAAFAMYPVSLEEIMKIADEGLVMPPKSTWFEPKLGSGLFVHRF